MSSVAKHCKIEMSEITQINQVMENGGMLNTILLPRNLAGLGSRLPKPNYNPSAKRTPSTSQLDTVEEEVVKRRYSSQQDTPTKKNNEKQIQYDKPQIPLDPSRHQIQPPQKYQQIGRAHV